MGVYANRQIKALVAWLNCLWHTAWMGSAESPGMSRYPFQHSFQKTEPFWPSRKWIKKKRVSYDMPERTKIPQRWHLYIVSFLHIMSFSTILPMIPFHNNEMELSGTLYALSFSGYYLLQFLSPIGGVA